jgi:hypothetical protein
MVGELDVLAIVSERLASLRVPFMLTGSYAMAYYATPRMTRDLDIVVELKDVDVDRFVATFAPDFYVDSDAARTAVNAQRPVARISSSLSSSGSGKRIPSCSAAMFARCSPVHWTTDTWSNGQRSSTSPGC